MKYENYEIELEIKNFLEAKKFWKSKKIQTKHAQQSQRVRLDVFCALEFEIKVKMAGGCFKGSSIVLKIL